MLIAAIYLALLSLQTLAIAYLIRRERVSPTSERPGLWFNHERFRHDIPVGPAPGVVGRVRAARGVIVHPCSFGGDLIEYQLTPDFPEDAVLATLAEIEAL